MKQYEMFQYEYKFEEINRGLTIAPVERKSYQVIINGYLT